MAAAQTTRRVALQLIGAAPFACTVSAGAIASVASPIDDLTTLWVQTSAQYFATMARTGEVSGSDPRYATRWREYDAAAVEDERVRRRIIDLRSTEPGAIVLKLAAFVVHCGGNSRIDGLIETVIRDAGLFEEALAMSLARDLAAMLRTPVEALAKAAMGEVA